MDFTKYNKTGAHSKEASRKKKTLLKSFGKSNFSSYSENVKLIRRTQIKLNK